MTGRTNSRRHGLTAVAVVVAVCGMVGLTYASVPLYRAFCKATGFAGTTQVATAAPAHTGARSVTVRFDANVGGGLPWTFEPETPEIQLRTGVTATVFYKVRNDSGRAVTGRAEYNVSPDVVGGYFDKISCFCFSEQTLAAGETVDMPVVFFLDPALEKDKSLAGVDSVTLSYTFYPVREPARPVAAGDDAAQGLRREKLQQGGLKRRLTNTIERGQFDRRPADANEEDFMADAHAKPKHDYHLVAPSPWPLFGSVAAFVMAVGLIIWMKGLTLFGLKIGPYLNIAGLAAVLYVMAMWWVDVVHEAEKEGAHTRVVQLSHRYGMMLFIASEVMFFVAWFWAYFNVSLFPNFGTQYLRTDFTGGHWPPKGVEAIDPWHLPLFNTLILLTSGTTITWAHHALLGGDRKSLKTGLILTILLGVLFTSVQAFEYAHAPFAFKQNIFGSTFFMATGFHGFHVIVGTIFLAVCLLRAFAGSFTPRQHIGFEFAAWYWHFVDVVWLFLFTAIYVWGTWGAPLEGAAG